MNKAILLIYLTGAGLCSGQTLVNLGRQGKAPDFGSMAHTRPVQIGSALPTTCVIGELFFNTASSSGQNLYGCVSDNSWEKLTGLGQCTMNSDGSISCPGKVEAGNGLEPGEVQILEKSAQGIDYISLLAPDSINTSYRLRLPANPPSDQLLVFAPISAGIAEGSWATRFTKVASTLYFPTAQKVGATGWTTGPGWTIPDATTGASVAGAGTAPYQVGYFTFPAAAKRYALLQTRMPSTWDGQAISAKVVWATQNGPAGSNVRWQASVACVEDGGNLLAPSFAPAMEITPTIPYPGDSTAKKVTSGFSPSVWAGCTTNSLVYVLISRDGTADTNTMPVLLFGVQLDFMKGLQ